MKSSFVIACVGIAQSGKTMLAKNLAAGFSKVNSNTLFIDWIAKESFSLKNNQWIKLQAGWKPTLLEEFQKSYDFIIIDAGALLSEDLKSIFEKISAILVTAPSHEESLQKTEVFLKKLYELIPRDLVYAILTYYDPKLGINPTLVKSQLGCNILGALVYDERFKKENKLLPFIYEYPDSVSAKYIDQLVKIILSRKILERGVGLWLRKQNVVPLHAPKISPPTESPHPKLFDRFAKEDLPKDPRTLQKLNILKHLTSELNLKKLDTETSGDPKKMAVLRQKTKQAVKALIERDQISFPSKEDRDQFIKEILDEALGLGPLEVLLADPSITEIMVNRKDQIYIEQNGKIRLSDMTFTSDAQLLGIIERIVAPLGRRIDEKTPYVDARLQDGSRVHAIIPPLAIQGPTITIRKFPERNYTVDDLIQFGSMNEEMADFLRAAIESRLNCVVSGGTGSGKTTLLNVLSSFIPERERIITVEDSAELRLTQPHVLRLESRPANIEGKGAVPIRDLVKNTLRMRPDRIVVGECRDGAALDMLQAMNTGHDGSLTTVHANSARDCLSRLETLVMMAGMDLPSRAIREQIASAVHLIVQQARLSDGSRKIISIHEVTGMEKEVITTSEIVRFKQTGIDQSHKVTGYYEFTGLVPRFIHELQRKGLRIPKGFRVQSSAGES